MYGERDSPKCQSFGMAVEGFCGDPEEAGPNIWLHNKFHNLIDGSRCCVGTAANDPLFILHHVQVDRMFSVSRLLST